MDRLSYMKIYNKEYYQKNKEREKERVKRYCVENQEKVRMARKEWYQKYGKAYRLKNIDKIRKRAREWARKHKQPYKWTERRKENQKRYREKHKEKIAEKRRAAFKRRLEKDINFRLAWLLRGRIISAIKKQLGNKAYKTIELLGCSIQEAREHIEKQWKDGMTWENHGKVWEIDHIIPVSKFNLKDPEEQKKAFHYTNLQPLSWQENRKKSNRIVI